MQLIEKADEWRVQDDTGMPNKNLGVAHAFDAFGYLCLQQFNLAKPETLGQTSFRIY